MARFRMWVLARESIVSGADGTVSKSTDNLEGLESYHAGGLSMPDVLTALSMPYRLHTD